MTRRVPAVLALSAALVAGNLCACTALLGANDPIEIVESGSTQPDVTETGGSEGSDARMEGSDAPTSDQMDGGSAGDVSAAETTVDTGPPVAVTYQLSATGNALMPSLRAIGDWARDHLDRPTTS